MEDSLALIERRYEELNELLASPEVVVDPDRVREYAQEQAGIAPTVDKYRQLVRVRAELASAHEMLAEADDDEMRALAQEEAHHLAAQQAALEDELRLLLVPTDPNDKRNVIVEIRAGAGGDEAGLFAGDLYRMYNRYAELRNWKTELISESTTGVGGFKEVIFQLRGAGAYSRLKYESGVHRVQRVPTTESAGRIHTSTATVAVLPEVGEVEININPEDIRMDVYRSSGAGGQHMQKNSTAIRLTHLPTGMVVSCENERSQLQNRIRAMAVLRARLYAMEQEKQHAAVESARRSQVGSGDRSEKIRTYNFPQNRVTDHRINLSVYQLETVLQGDLDEFIEALTSADQAERLQAAGLERG
ncbi:MAG: peptide chain release factor 1 [Chloroflexi bacterium]|nr:peptide chain release factor 1 [Chloroflexota bacterium]